MSVYSIPENLLDEYYSSSRDPNYFYETSNKRDYKGTHGVAAPSARPITSTFYSKTDTEEETSYSTEFGWKHVDREDIWKPGNERNKPHPNKEFLEWNPRNKPYDGDGNTDLKQLLDKLCREKLKSTYQVDYQSGKNELRKDLPQQNLKKAPETMNTSIRVDYQPVIIKNKILKNSTTRYGHNLTKTTPAIGAVPASFLKTNLSYCSPKAEKSEQHKDDVAEENSGKQERISSWEGPSW